MKPYKCKNKACQKVLGYASARLFETGGIVLDRRTSFRCQSCQRLHLWEPAKAAPDTTIYSITKPQMV